MLVLIKYVKLFFTSSKRKNGGWTLKCSSGLSASQDDLFKIYPVLESLLQLLTDFKDMNFFLLKKEVSSI